TRCIPVAIPEQFDGSPDRRKNFLMQCSMYFSHYAVQFITDKDLVQFVLSLLTGDAGAWETALWDSQDPASIPYPTASPQYRMNPTFPVSLLKPVHYSPVSAATTPINPPGPVEIDRELAYAVCALLESWR
ncbi:hypothetical protein P4O66_021775, partial [Electrophorus voltai]